MIFTVVQIIAILAIVGLFVALTNFFVDERTFESKVCYAFICMISYGVWFYAYLIGEQTLMLLLHNYVNEHFVPEAIIAIVVLSAILYLLIFGLKAIPFKVVCFYLFVVFAGPICMFTIHALCVFGYILLFAGDASDESYSSYSKKVSSNNTTSKNANSNFTTKQEYEEPNYSQKEETPIYTQNSYGNLIGSNGATFERTNNGDWVGSNGVIYRETHYGDWIGSNGVTFYKVYDDEWVGSNGVTLCKNYKGELGPK